MAQVIDLPHYHKYEKNATWGEEQTRDYLAKLPGNYVVFPEYCMAVPAAQKLHDNRNYMDADFIIIDTLGRKAWVLEVKDYKADSIETFGGDWVTFRKKYEPKKNPYRQVHEYEAGIKDQFEQSQGEVFRRTTGRAKQIRLGWGVIFTNMDRNEFRKQGYSLNASMHKTLFADEAYPTNIRDFQQHLDRWIKAAPLISSDWSPVPEVDNRPVPPTPPPPPRPRSFATVTAGLSALLAVALIAVYKNSTLPAGDQNAPCRDCEIVHTGFRDGRLNVRSDPRVDKDNHNVIGNLAEGTTVHVLARQSNGWDEVDSNGFGLKNEPLRLHGFVNGKLLTPNP